MSNLKEPHYKWAINTRFNRGSLACGANVRETYSGLVNRQRFEPFIVCVRENNSLQKLVLVGRHSGTGRCFGRHGLGGKSRATINRHSSHTFFKQKWVYIFPKRKLTIH